MPGCIFLLRKQKQSKELLGLLVPSLPYTLRLLLCLISPPWLSLCYTQTPFLPSPYLLTPQESAAAVLISNM